MALNGTEILNDPWNVTFSPYTNLFEELVGNGQLFYLLPLIVLTFGIYIKTEGNAIMATMFMIGSGALLGSASLFAGASSIAVAFWVFTAFGITGLFLSLIFQRGG